MKKPEMVAATEFKAHCLALLEEVRQTPQSILVTRHGRPVAEILPYMPKSAEQANPLKGSLRFEGDVISPLVKGSGTALRDRPGYAHLERPKVVLLPFTPAAAIRAAGSGGSFPGDPADRLIVGTALEMSAPLIIRDQRITDWGHVQTVW